MHRDDTGLVEDYGRRFFVLSIATEIETFCFRIRKNVVISVVEIRKSDRATDVDGNQVAHRFTLKVVGPGASKD